MAIYIFSQFTESTVHIYASIPYQTLSVKPCSSNSSALIEGEINIYAAVKKKGEKKKKRQQLNLKVCTSLTPRLLFFISSAFIEAQNQCKHGRKENERERNRLS